MVGHAGAAPHVLKSDEQNRPVSLAQIEVPHRHASSLAMDASVLEQADGSTTQIQKSVESLHGAVDPVLVLNIRSTPLGRHVQPRG